VSPCSELFDIVEQYWLVTWDLRHQSPHTQRNLPDPCASLFFDKQGAKLLGAMSKSYAYEMKNKGYVFGVKFKPAGLCSYTPEPMSGFAERYSDPMKTFPALRSKVFKALNSVTRLDEAIAEIEHLLLMNMKPVTQKQHLANAIVDHIKTASEIADVQQVAKHFEISVRALQRLFQQYVGLSPKWIIRKYRLHEVLNKIENHEQDWLTLSFTLGYTDQSHFIRDFKDMIGMTPDAYLKQHLNT
jgi:AraC-like DNA-binding protein